MNAKRGRNDDHAIRRSLGDELTKSFLISYECSQCGYNIKDLVQFKPPNDPKAFFGMNEEEFISVFRSLFFQYKTLSSDQIKSFFSSLNGGFYEDNFNIFGQGVSFSGSERNLNELGFDEAGMERLLLKGMSPMTKKEVKHDQGGHGKWTP